LQSTAFLVATPIWLWLWNIQYSEQPYCCWWTHSYMVLNYVSFRTGLTRSSTGKLNRGHMTAPTNNIMSSYFYRLPRLWNHLPTIDLSRPPNEIKSKLKRYFWNHFLTHFDSNHSCTFVHVPTVPRLLPHIIITCCNSTLC